MQDRTNRKLVKDAVIVLLLGSSLIALPQLKAAYDDLSQSRASAGAARTRSIDGDVGAPINHPIPEAHAEDKMFIRSAFPDIAEWQAETVIALLGPVTSRHSQTARISDIPNTLDSSLGELKGI